MTFPKEHITYLVLLWLSPWRTEQTMKMKTPAPDKLRQMTTCLKVSPTLRPLRMGLECQVTLKLIAWQKSFCNREQQVVQSSTGYKPVRTCPPRLGTWNKRKVCLAMSQHPGPLLPLPSPLLSADIFSLLQHLPIKVNSASPRAHLRYFCNCAIAS